MTSKRPAWLRLILSVLWICVVAGLCYQNYTLKQDLKSARLGQFTPEEQVMASNVRSLIATNKTLLATWQRQRLNFKECMTLLPKKEVELFYQRNREELERAQGSAVQP